MKLRTIITLALALTVTVGTTAKVNKKKAVKAKAGAKAVIKVDTVSTKDFSYAMGAAQVNGLKPYLAMRMGVDTLANMDDFVRGLRELFANPADKKLSAYSAGLQIGSQVLTQFLAQLNQQITGKDTAFIDVEQYKQGFLSGITGQGLKFPVDSATAIANRQMQYYKSTTMEKQYGENRKAGEAFMAENAKKPGVKTLPSGVQYKVIKEGTGAKPSLNSTVKVNYEGKTIDGTVFDSSYKTNKPVSFNLSRVIKGWGEAITNMPVGSTWEIYIPQQLGYGEQQAGDKIKPFSALIFKVELLGIEEEAPTKK